MTGCGIELDTDSDFTINWSDPPLAYSYVGEQEYVEFTCMQSRSRRCIVIVSDDQDRVLGNFDVPVGDAFRLPRTRNGTFMRVGSERLYASTREARTLPEPGTRGRASASEHHAPVD